MSQCKDQHGSKKNQPRHQQIASTPSCRRSSQPCKYKRASGRTNQGKAGLRRSIKESAIFSSLCSAKKDKLEDTIEPQPKPATAVKRYNIATFCDRANATKATAPKNNPGTITCTCPNVFALGPQIKIDKVQNKANTAAKYPFCAVSN